jgi:hypothetical protein
LVDAPFPKSLYDSVKIEVYFDIINLVRNYMVVNELKSPYENKSFKKNLKCTCFKKIKWNPPKNYYDMELWKYGSF